VSVTTLFSYLRQIFKILSPEICSKFVIKSMSKLPFRCHSGHCPGFCIILYFHSGITLKSPLMRVLWLISHDRCNLMYTWCLSSIHILFLIHYFSTNGTDHAQDISVTELTVLLSPAEIITYFLLQRIRSCSGIKWRCIRCL